MVLIYFGANVSVYRNILEQLDRFLLNSSLENFNPIRTCVRSCKLSCRRFNQKHFNFFWEITILLLRKRCAEKVTKRTKIVYNKIYKSKPLLTIEQFVENRLQLSSMRQNDKVFKIFFFTYDIVKQGAPSTMKRNKKKIRNGYDWKKSKCVILFGYYVIFVPIGYRNFDSHYFPFSNKYHFGSKRGSA